MAACLSPTLLGQPIHGRCCWTPKLPSSSITTYYQHPYRRIIGISSIIVSAHASPVAAAAAPGPLDKKNTLLLKAIPGLNDIGKALLGPVSEQVMVLQNIGSSVLVSENQAVLAHDLGHLKCDHGVWLTFANILTTGAYTVPGFGMVAGFLEEQLFRWLRAAELTCDRAALVVVRDPKVVMSVLMKLAGGCPSLADQLNVDAFLEQARSYDKASSNPVGWYIRVFCRNAQTRELSHPLPVMRAREVDEWSRSQEYRTLLRKMFQ